MARRQETNTTLPQRLSLTLRPYGSYQEKSPISCLSSPFSVQVTASGLWEEESQVGRSTLELDSSLCPAGRPVGHFSHLCGMAEGRWQTV